MRPQADSRTLQPAALMASICVGLWVSLSGADAAVLISSGTTTNITCTSGVCTPTKKGAILNIAQLQSLLASGNITVTTGGALSSDILVTAAFGWASAHGLTLDAYHSITVDKAVAVNGTGSLTLTTDDGGSGGSLSFGPKGRIGFLSTANSLTIDGAAYTLVADTTTLASDIAVATSGNFALANDYNASDNSANVITTFSGNFQGLGNTISSLTLQPSTSSSFLGLFDNVASGGAVENVRLKKISYSGDATSSGGVAGLSEGLISGDSASGNISLSAPTAIHAGGLVGQNYGGLVVDSYASVNVSTKDSKESSSVTYGGLVGLNTGSISGCYATGNAKTLGSDWIGGLVGFNFEGTITDSYATGRATGGPKAHVGGLVGQNAPSADSAQTISNSYSTGIVTVGAGGDAGGLVGFDNQDPTGVITDAYWDTTTSGITSSSQGAGNIANDPGITGLSTTQLQSGLPAGFSSTVWGESSTINGGLPYLLAAPPA